MRRLNQVSFIKAPKHANDNIFYFDSVSRTAISLALVTLTHTVESEISQSQGHWKRYKIAEVNGFL